MKDKNVFVIGTGTIGLPLIGLLARHKNKFGIDNVFFSLQTSFMAFGEERFDESGQPLYHHSK